jgi:hypothetical protein
MATGELGDVVSDLGTLLAVVFLPLHFRTQGKITSGSSHDELVTRTLPSGCATATSESLSVLAWIWLMDPQLPLIFPMPINYWKGFGDGPFTMARTP